jgi:signal transduction histidine kinase
MNRWWTRWRGLAAWPFGVALFVLCGGLGFLQFRWIGEVSMAERDRLRKSLQGSLERLSHDFDFEISNAYRALAPSEPSAETAAARQQLIARFRQWKNSTRHPHLFHRVAMADSNGALRMMNQSEALLEAAEWPAEWKAVRERLADFARGPGRGGRRGPDFQPRPPMEEENLIFLMPLMSPFRPGAPPGAFRAPERAWLIVELDQAYLREALIPELAQRHLGSGGALDYAVEVWTKATPAALVYQSDPGNPGSVGRAADASIGLFSARFDPGFRPRVLDGGPGRGPGPQPGFDAGRWQLFVRHRGGSLEDIVAETRRRNLAVNAGALLLMALSAAALIRFTRRAQRLAELQLEFVAGVSHELRTPLTIIHTAAHNLRGKLAHNPAQVERYGELIQKESARLRDLVEQVMRFAGANAGHVIRDPKPIAIAEVIREALEAVGPTLQTAGCKVETNLASELPLILGDPMSLKQALINLLDNAAKYGAKGNGWVGIFASQLNDKGQPSVELRVADRGPGIPPEEQPSVFEPFFRGRGAVNDQIHGAGLGLNIVKKIVEAHGGSIRVKSAPSRGAEFVMRIPAAPRERVDEFANSAD